MIESGVREEKKAEFIDFASQTLELWNRTYNLACAFRVYQHLIFIHGLDLQAKQGHPLGKYSNQIAEHEHHLHNAAFPSTMATNLDFVALARKASQLCVKSSKQNS